MIKINLISDLQEKKLQTKKLNQYVTFGSIALILVILVIIIIIWGVIATERALTTSTNNKIADTSAQLSQYKDLETNVISLEKGLAGTKEILNGKDQWTKLLVHLEAATPADVAYTGLKLSNNELSAELTGKDVDSLARYINSYKNYVVLSLSGAGSQGQTVNLSTNGQTYVTQVKNNGTWNYAVPFSPTKDQSITVTAKAVDPSHQDAVSTISYSASDQKLTTPQGVTAISKKLFSSIDSKGYTKDQNGAIKFDVTMKFDEATIW